MATKLPGVSFVIPVLNSARTLQRCLASIVRQDYPHSQIEVIILDGGSTDQTPQIAKSFPRLNVRFIRAGYATNMEARRYLGFKRATFDLICILDSDNYLADATVLRRLVKPLVKYPQVTGSFSLHYHFVSQLRLMNRYIGLFGHHDPVAFYLKKADRQKITDSVWPDKSQIVEHTPQWTIVAFTKDNFPTLGCNGTVIRKRLINLKKLQPIDFFHTDILYDLLDRGYNRYAVVDVPIIHDSSPSILHHLRKRLEYMSLHSLNLSSRRRYQVFNPRPPRDVYRLALFVVYTLTLVEPLSQSVRGYLKKPDSAWFLHPLLCWAFLVTYAWAVIKTATHRWTSLS